MSKSRRPSARRAAPRRKPAARAAAAKRSTAKRKPKRGDAIQLKPIREAIVRAVEGLRSMPPTEAIKLTIERLQRCIAEFDAVCADSDNGCGPNMDFPWP